jgi:hypothetical protein
MRVGQANSFGHLPYTSTTKISLFKSKIFPTFHVNLGATLSRSVRSQNPRSNSRITQTYYNGEPLTHRATARPNEPPFNYFIIIIRLLSRHVLMRRQVLWLKLLILWILSVAEMKIFKYRVFIILKSICLVEFLFEMSCRELITIREFERS